jgi:hypothetical protein
MLGGALLVVWAGLVASRPRGDLGGYERVHHLAPLAFVALVLIAAGLAGVRARSAGSIGLVGQLAALAGIGGVALFAAGAVFVTVDPGTATRPFLIPAGTALLIAGSLALAIILSRLSEPRWPAALLIAGSLALIAAAPDGWRAWLFAPYGLAWLPLGYSLWSGRGERAPPATEG